MVNKKQRKMLIAQGVQAWNEWRESHRRELIDLSGADLREANLSGADLREANLLRADLHEANVSGANLREANVSGADLRGADLSGADLSEADLREANLSRATLGYTVLGNVDLRGVKGLESAVHIAPSTIGIDTIYRSHGEIPEVFLRQAGVPETFLTNMRALVDAMRPIDFYSCFISYC